MTVSALAASAVGLARNESGRRFPHAEEAAALEELRTQIVETLTGNQWDRRWRIYDLDEMSDVEIVHLVEQGLMTPAFADASGPARGFAVYGQGEASLEINGDDHFRLLGYRTGGRLPGLWSLLSRLDDQLEMVFSYAFDPQWGYLTARPRQAGCGMRAYATLHLPVLTLTGRLAETALELAGNGLAVMPLWGGAGGIVQVSNVDPLGRSEDEILQQIDEISRNVVEKERSVRKMLVRENPVQTRDQIGRALGVAQHAWTMAFHEAVNLVSAAQVGIELGIAEVPGMEAGSAFELMSRLQPAHIIVDYMEGKGGCLESPEIDEYRARAMREIFAGASVPV